MELNLTIKCRGCLVEEPEMHNLFQLVTDNLTLANILSETTSTQIDQNEEISPCLCLKCTKIIVDFYNFKIEFDKSQAYFQSEVKKPIQNEKTNEHNILFIDGNEDLVINNTNNANKDLLEKLKSKETLATDNTTGFYKNTPTLVPLQTIVRCDDKGYMISEGNKLVKPEVGEFTIQNELVQLIESVVFCCKNCNKEYLLKYDFLQHMNIKHGKKMVDASKFTKNTLVKMPLGNIKVENFDSDFDLDYDANINEKLCKICNAYVLKTAYESHYNEHKGFFCNCGAKFLKKKDLVNHNMSVHSDERQFLCKYCNKGFKLKQALTKHLKYHTHPRSEMCHICGKVFNDKSVLNTHIQLKHYPTRDFQCNHCGLNFPLKSTLFKHIRRHHTVNRQRTFSCSMCNMTYFEKATLNRHISVKHSDQPVKARCKHCNKSFTTKGNLYKHLRTSHKYDTVV